MRTLLNSGAARQVAELRRDFHDGLGLQRLDFPAFCFRD